jgi:hypothetical protein
VTVMMWIRAALFAIALALFVWAYVANRVSGPPSGGDAGLGEALGLTLLVASAFFLSTIATASWLVQIIWRSIFD